jgi:hypothetical protein
MVEEMLLLMMMKGREKKKGREGDQRPLFIGEPEDWELDDESLSIDRETDSPRTLLKIVETGKIQTKKKNDQVQHKHKKGKVQEGMEVLEDGLGRHDSHYF